MDIDTAIDLFLPAKLLAAAQGNRSRRQGEEVRCLS